MENLLSPLYKFIVLLEERGKVDETELGFKSDKTNRGVIGKMDALKFIKRSESKISLSNEGYKFLNSILSSLHKSVEHFDGKWRVVYFSTPEVKRSSRDRFRRELEALGFRPIIKGLWFSPMPLLDEVRKAEKRCSMTSMVVMMETSEVSLINEQSISRAWEFEESRKNFDEFIKLSEELLKEKSQDRVKIKQLIFYFALVLAREPNLPIELLPKDWPKYRAMLMYKRLKNLLMI